MKIHIYNSQKDLSILKACVRSLVQVVLKEFSSQHLEVSIYFVSEKKISALHDEFFNDPRSTDCISFPVDKEYLGDVFICPKTALIYSAKKNLDPYEETALYVIHGLLHCLGYDDLEPHLKKIMRKKEKSCMALLKKHNIYLGVPRLCS